MSAPNPSIAARARARTACAWALLALLAACGGDGGDAPADAAAPPTAQPPAPPPPPPPAPGNQAPVPRFDAPAAAVAGQPAVFDARSSSDPDGGALRFSWDFGDGGAAGTAQVAHLYPAAGTYSARLLVSDAQGATATLTRSVTVGAAPVAVRTVSVAGRVSGIDGLPLAGVTVSVEGRSGAGSSATTDADGRTTLNVGVGVNVVLRLAKTGYTDQIKSLNLPSVAGSDASFEASLMPRAAALTLADAAAGGSVTGPDGASLQLPAAALVDAVTGAAVTGAVQLNLTPVDVNAAAVAAFPGRFEGVNGDGSRTPIVSYGTTEFVLSQGGRPLQLKPGARATVDLPVYASQSLGGAVLAAGGRLPLWSLDERSALWVNEGEGTLVAAPASPTGLALRAEVGHFSWWNADKGFLPYRPKPRCINDVPGQYDSIFEQATICKMLAEMDKPIPAQGSAPRPDRARALAVATAASTAASSPAPRFPFPAVRIDGDVPMAGGVAIDIPPDYDVVLTGTALNGTWRGRVLVKGGEGATADISVPLRPVLAGGADEAITLPFDAVRAAAALRIDSYRFSVVAAQSVDITLAREGSSLTGLVRVRNAAGELLDGSDFGTDAARLRVQLPAAGEYRIEVQPQLGAPGGYRLQAAAAAAAAGVPSQRIGNAAPLGAPAVVSLGDRALALWVQAGSSGPQLMGSRYLGASEGWSGAAVLAAATGYDEATGLQARANAAGDVWVLWADASGPRVTRGSLAAGAVWTAPLPLASAACTGGAGLTQRLAVNATGQAVVMWQRASGGTGWCARRHEAGAWSAEALLVSTPPASGAGLALALTAAGQAVAAWPLDNFGGLAVAQQDSAAAGWSAPVLRVPANNSVALPALAAAADGSLMLAWQGVGEIRAAHRPAGQDWGAAQRLGDAGTSGFPQAVWLGGERFAVGFNSFNSGPRIVEHRATTGWGAAVAVGTNLNLPILVSLAAGGDGSAIAISLANGRGGAGTGTELGFARRAAATGQWVDAALPLAARQATGGNVLSRYAPVSADAGRASALWLEQPIGTTPRIRAARLSAEP